MAVNKLDPKIIFASEAPAQDVPAVFTNKTVGWGDQERMVVVQQLSNQMHCNKKQI